MVVHLFPMLLVCLLISLVNNWYFQLSELMNLCQSSPDNGQELLDTHIYLLNDLCIRHNISLTSWVIEDNTDISSTNTT